MNTTLPGTSSAVTTPVGWPVLGAGQTDTSRVMLQRGNTDSSPNDQSRYLKPGSTGPLQTSQPFQVLWTTCSSPVHRNLLGDLEEKWSE